MITLKTYIIRSTKLYLLSLRQRRACRLRIVDVCHHCGVRQLDGLRALVLPFEVRAPERHHQIVPR